MKEAETAIDVAKQTDTDWNPGINSDTGEPWTTDELLDMITNENKALQLQLRQMHGTLDPWSLINDRLDLIVTVMFPVDDARKGFELVWQKVLFGRLKQAIRAGLQGG